MKKADIDVTEAKFQELMGSDVTHLEIQTGSGKRYIDNVLDGTAREVKSGNVTWGAYKEQVLKDIQIIKAQTKKISKIEWHCFSDVPDSFIDNVKKELLDNGLEYGKDFIVIKY